MSVASGIASQVGIAPEVTYGTFVAPTRFTQVDKCDLKKVKNVTQGMGLGAGRLMALGSRRVPTLHSGAGTIPFETVNKGMGLWLQALFGSPAAPVQQGTTTAYLQTHTLADNIGKYLSIQHGVPDQTGVVRPYSFTGCKVTSGDFSFDIGAQATVMSTYTIDARDVSESQALAAASYPTSTRPFVGTDVAVKIGAFGSEAAITGVRKVDIKFDRPQATDRYYFSNAGLKSEPIENDYVKVTGTIDADYIDKAVWADRFASDSSTSLVIEAVSTTLAGVGFYDTFRLHLPMIFLEGDTPVVDGPDIVKGSFPFTCLFDGTNYPFAEYLSSDTTL